MAATFNQSANGTLISRPSDLAPLGSTGPSTKFVLGRDASRISCNYLQDAKRETLSVIDNVKRIDVRGPMPKPSPYDPTPQPDDARNGEWSQGELRTMDAKFCEAMQRAQRAQVMRRLTGEQLRAVLVAARHLRQRSREPFLQSVAQELVGREIGDGAVDRAIRVGLETLRGERTVTLND